jgi:hypothetical protein
MRADVGEDEDGEQRVQDVQADAELLPPSYWLDVLRERGLHTAGTVLISGTIPMVHGVDQFADSWRVELGDPATGETIELAYRVRRLPEPIG